MQRYVGRNLQNEQSSGKISVQFQSNTGARIKDVTSMFLGKWYWFLLSLIVTVGLAIWYLESTPPVYERSVSMLIKTSGNTDPLLKDLGLTPATTNLVNEMELLKTSELAGEITRRLNLNVENILKGQFHDEVLYGAESPVKVKFVDLPDEMPASMRLTFVNKKEVRLDNFSKDDESGNKEIVVSYNDTVVTPLGRVVVEQLPTNKAMEPGSLEIRHNSLSNVARSVQNRIVPALREKSSTIIDVSFRDVSKPRAEDVLSCLVDVYNENWVSDRNLQTVNTDQFIRNRLALIEDELGNVEHDISEWKSENLMLDVGAAGSFAQTQVNEAERQLNDLSSQEYMTRYIRDYLTDGQHNDQPLPANSGITNSSIERLISEYNALLLRRNSHISNSSTHNPLVQDMDENLAALRSSILQSLDYEITMLQSKGRAIKGQRGAAVSKIAVNPGKAQQLLSVERQQKVKEDLYLYLLKRREENELSQAFGAYNNRLIETPRGSSMPVEPVPALILSLAVIVGIFVPAVAISGKEMLNTKIRGKKDLEDLSAPYVGDLPEAENAAKKKKSKKGKAAAGKDNSNLPVVLVEDKNRNVINEAFRVIRTNLEFMLGFDKSHHVVMLTSILPGSGKTFITANLTTALALRGKKVLIVDLDLRKGTLSDYVGNPAQGVSAYLSGQEHDLSNLIVELGKVDVLPCGALPPNPSELLSSRKFSDLIEKLKTDYDYVFLDCPPVEVVADTAIISKYTDLTLFVVRVGRMEREMLADVERWYHDKKFGNLAVILNGIPKPKSRYESQRHGYHYGSYGYGN